MKRYLGFLLFVFVLPLASGAQFTRSVIIKTADGKIRQLLGESLFGHSYNINDTRYTYTDDSGHIQAAFITEKDSITKGRLDQIYVNYVFEYQYPELQDTTIFGEFNIVLDRFLQTVRVPDLSFIPAYLWHIKENDFLSQTAIAKIAEANGLDKHKPGIEYAVTLYHIRDDFAYMICGRPVEFDLASKDYELMVIDARTGVVLHHKFGEDARALEREMRGK